MDERLKNALDFSNYRQTLAVQRKSLTEKMQAKLTYGYNGGIFKIDRTLLCFVWTLCSENRTSDIVLLDQNDNPILIENLSKFKTEIFDRYFSVSLEYQKEFDKIKKSRSVEKLVDHE
jgi:hypothetical protein